MANPRALSVQGKRRDIKNKKGGSTALANEFIAKNPWDTLGEILELTRKWPALARG